MLRVVPGADEVRRHRKANLEKWRRPQTSFVLLQRISHRYLGGWKSLLFYIQPWKASWLPWEPTGTPSFLGVMGPHIWGIFKPSIFPWVVGVQGWNLKITCLEIQKIIWTKPPWLGFKMLIFQGVTYSKHTCRVKGYHWFKGVYNLISV